MGREECINAIGTRYTAMSAQTDGCISLSQGAV